MNRQIAIEIIVFLFVLLFVYAAASKFMDLDQFQAQIGQSPLLTNIAGAVAWFIPAIEIVISVLLAVPKTRLAGLLAALSLMMTFTLYIVIIMNFSEHVPCSCGGVLQRMTWRDHLLFNIGFILLAGLGVFLEHGSQKRKQDILLQ